MRSVIHSQPRVLAAVGALLASVVFAGCTGSWSGDGKKVASAIEKASAAKTSKFSGSLQLKMSGVPASFGGPSNVAITLKGASDYRDAAKPRLWMEIGLGEFGQPVRIVMPGNGKVYTTIGDETYASPFAAESAGEFGIDNARLLTALGASVGGFKSSQPMTAPDGKKVPAVTASVDKGKLCGPVLASLGGALNSGVGGGGEDLAKSFGAALGEGMKEMCESLLQSDPQLWFGITDGALTDLALTAKLAMPMGVAMTLTGQYHLSDLDKDIGKIEVPSGAIEVDSPEQIASLAG